MKHPDLDSELPAIPVMLFICTQTTEEEQSARHMNYKSDTDDTLPDLSHSVQHWSKNNEAGKALESCGLSL